jgi:hypothetical protein
VEKNYLGYIYNLAFFLGLFNERSEKLIFVYFLN